MNILDIHHNFKSDLKILAWFTFPISLIFFLYWLSFLLSFSCLLLSKYLVYPDKTIFHWACDQWASQEHWPKQFDVHSSLSGHKIPGKTLSWAHVSAEPVQQQKKAEWKTNKKDFSPTFIIGFLSSFLHLSSFHIKEVGWTSVIALAVLKLSLLTLP